MSCADARPPEPAPQAPVADVPRSDLVETEQGKADGTLFDPHRLISDDAFTDSRYLSADDVQGFFEISPYGGRSWLADFDEGGRSAAAIIVDAAHEFGINPLVLLTKLQVESSLVSQHAVPGDRLVSRAMGCACPDNRPCSSAFAGFTSQVECAAGLFADYLADIQTIGTTLTGWGPGLSGASQDGVSVRPENAATAALYTYTPWVLTGSGGNWLFWNVYRKYLRHTLNPEPNHRWIGGACDDELGCGIVEGVCLTDSEGGSCSLACDRFCPDSDNPNTSLTFCAELDPANPGATGFCVSQCDVDLFPYGDGGCREGFACTARARFGEPAVVRSVCLPL